MDMNSESQKVKIPKLIHYIWLGNAPLPPLAELCIQSWKKYLPGYEVVCWDEHNIWNMMNEYSSEAYTAQKWAFVSDYLRFQILYRYGGVYFDTDVELIRPIEDIMESGPWMACEHGGGHLASCKVNAGLGMAASAGMSLYQEIIGSYDSDHFRNYDGTYNLETVVDRVTKILRHYGLRDTDRIQKLAGITVYPSDYFCPKDYASGKCVINEVTRSIHHYDASWLSTDKKRAIELKWKIIRCVPWFPTRIAVAIGWLGVCLEKKSIRPLIRRVYKEASRFK